MKCIKDLWGTKRWYLNNKLHRVDGPAIKYPDGTTKWYLEDNLHRIDGPAVKYSDGDKHWFLDGKRHRVDGPAIEYSSGIKYWYLNDILHRIDGPAIEDSSGIKMWYLDGVEFEKSEYFALVKTRKFRSKIFTLSNALGFNPGKTLKLSRNRTVVEWYYSPDNGGGKSAKRRLENIINYIHYPRSD